MARTVDQINQVIIDKVNSDPTLSGVLTSTSKVSVWRLFAYAVSYCIWTLEVLFDKHRADVDNILSTLKPHRLTWYQQKSLAFMYGYSLVQDTDKYDLSNLTEDEIEEAKIVKYAAVSEAESRVLIKVATEENGELVPLSLNQKDVFSSYMNEIKDAGVPITVISSLPDQLFIYLRIFYDPLILDESGNNIISGGRPVEEALQQYMRQLPFNGKLVLTYLVDYLQQIPGVIIPHLDAAYTSYIIPSGYSSPEIIDIQKTPEAGYFEIPNFDNIQYFPYV
jgi:hypothetical protein